MPPAAARLANRATDPQQKASDSTWAENEWQWFAQSGMLNSQNLINDGLNSNCANNGGTVWSYNQGVILGGLAALSKLTQNSSLLPQARKIALAAITYLTDSNGILHDSCEPNCDGDGVQFKGIFVRNLTVLDSALPDPQYNPFLQANARSIWAQDQGPDYEFGQVWSGPYIAANAASQTSALDAFLAAYEVSTGNFN
jgi:predicted alpha-1,6-mannanase (GH76 family)